MPDFTAIVELATVAATAGGALALIARALARRARKRRATRNLLARRPREVVRREWRASPEAGPGRRVASARGTVLQRAAPAFPGLDDGSGHLWRLPHYQVDETSWDSFEAIARRAAAADGGTDRGRRSAVPGMREAADFDLA